MGGGGGGVASGAASGAAAGTAISPGWGTVIGAGVGAVGSLLGGKKSKKSADTSQQQAVQQQLQLAQLQNQWGRENSDWSVNTNREITNENQERINQQTIQNRPNQISDFGSIMWGPNGEQIASLTPEQQAMLGSLRGKQADMIGGLESGFGVDNSVMAAMRGLQAPQLQQRRDAETARLAAMGLSTGSGSAWGNAISELNNAENNADLQAILAGNTAWNQSQQNMRSNLAALAGLETGWNSNLVNRPTFASAGVTQQAQTSPSGTPSLSGVVTNASNIGNAAGQATGDAWAAASQGLGNLAGSAWDLWNKPSAGVDGTDWSIPEWNQEDIYSGYGGNAYDTYSG